MSKLLATLPDGKVCDFIDQKIRNDTPEEYVRQNIERRLVLELGYLPEQIEVEYPIKQGSKTVRVDLAIFREGDQHNQENIWIIIECKKDSVPPSASKDGVEQLRSYMAACDNSEWGMWTNGKKKTVLRRIRTEEGIEYEEPNDIPSKDGNIEEVDRPTRDALKNAVGDNLLFSFKICHDHIYVTDGLQKQPAFFELLKVIFCKIYDERNVRSPLEFYATALEKKSNDGRLTVFNRISKIFDAVKKQYPAIFDANDEIKLQPRSLAYIVGELQRYSFLSTNIDVKGKAYEELVGANLRGDRGEFFTPRNVQKMTIRMLDPKVTDKVLDQSCGTGGFLVIAMNEVIEKLKTQIKKQSGKVAEQAGVWSEALNESIKETARSNFFGIDINPDLVKATKMNMVMNNDGSGNIFRQDSLLHPHQWEGSFRKQFAKALNIDPKSLRGEKDLAHFDLIATNPPFGSKLPIKDQETLKQYQLGHVWRETETGWEPTDQLQTSAPPEILFIERCWQFLKPSGRMGIVLPDAILGAPGLLYVRYWMIKHCRIVASIDLHPDTFQPRNGTQTSVLILQKKTEEEINRGTMPDYEIFMAQVKAIGHDKRGKTVYRRNEEGEEILYPPKDQETIPLLERTATGEGTVRPLARQKQEDDDTEQVANEFIDWKKQVVLGW
ncbi:N-6 DNA methylase [Candidatus Synechococcus calcipolaris G9]|uniref:N-6 DNA methylase n=1 Tax=Candidatus Synechococcus calcipolaris G9 TaxID=1497997 RepID=A0ABT6EXU3_9SYNE|nr:N-6 DNA methylase [Candidatus Synechococcus calcipolaris]MDG2990598.1 N-6 DNA methylase [Candidatus Synechococcus calcipolaris G9]